MSETWLSESFDDEVFGLKDYTIYRTDRLGRIGGGVAIFVSQVLKCKPLTVDFKGHEVCGLDVMGVGGDSCRLLCVYRPPNYSLAETRSLTECLQRAVSNCRSFSICGDFNLPALSWFPPTYNDDSGEIMFTFIALNGLVQHISEPTHIGGNILDLVLSSDTDLVSHLSIREPLLADHMSVFFNINFRTSQNSSRALSRQFNKSYSLIPFLSDINWDLVYELSADPVHFWQETKLVILHGIESLLPYNKLGLSKNCLFPLSNDTNLAIKQKKTAYDNWSLHLDLFWYDCLKYWTKKCTWLVSRDRSSHELSIALNPDSSVFHSYVKKVLNRSNVIPDLEVDGLVLRTDQAKADCFNKFFVSVFSEDNGIMPRFVVPNLLPGVFVDSVVFSEMSVAKAISGMKSSGSTGSDNIPSVLLKQCVDVVSLPLSTLFTSCFQSEQLPNDFRYANVVPVFKKSGSSSSPNNYRPISLTSSTGKVMETCVKDVLLEYLISNNLLSTHQHGFLPKKSTLSELLECINDWLSSLDNNELVDVIYIDLKKAFDSVVHSKLLKKCEKYGIVGKLLTYIRLFLSDRWQRVKVGESFSKWERVTSGVPQGSVLGPLLFLIYINDMPDILNLCKAKLYADDSKIYRAGPRTLPRVAGIQRDLTTFEIWCSSWQLNVNASKCSVLKIGFQRNDHMPMYQLGENMLDVKSSMKDLGVLVDSHLDFSQHCSAICSRTSRKIGLVYRCFASRDLCFMVQMFVTHVRPVLEYNTEVWSPGYVKDIDMVENVQRRYTKRIKGLFDLSYPDRLIDKMWFAVVRITPYKERSRAGLQNNQRPHRVRF